ncbi:MAG: hypothetical protein PVH87_21165 [Desulfobacteraceae bacterium]
MLLRYHGYSLKRLLYLHPVHIHTPPSEGRANLRLLLLHRSGTKAELCLIPTG